MPPGAETTKDGMLRIARVKQSDSGTYKCVATNHIGSSEAVVKVTIKGELVFKFGYFIRIDNMCPLLPSNLIFFLFFYSLKRPVHAH